MEQVVKYDFDKHLNDWKSRENSLTTDIRTESDSELETSVPIVESKFLLWSLYFFQILKSIIQRFWKSQKQTV